MLGENEGQIHQIDPRTLRFRDPVLESRYQSAHLARSLPVVRTALLLGVILFAAFGALDYMLARDTLIELWTIRFGVAIPALAVAYALIATDWAYQYHQAILAFAMVVAGFSIIAMTVVASMPAAHLYYAGVILVIIYCTTLFRLYFIYGAAISLSLFVGYVVAASSINPIPTWVLVGNTFFLSVVAGVGVFISYIVDAFLRRLFAQTISLEEAHSEALDLKVRAMEANHAKTLFLAMMSHELRTPLTAISGFSEMMRDEVLGPIATPRYREYARDINDSSRFLQDILDDILDISHASSGELRLQESRVNLTALVAEVKNFLREQAASRGITTSCELPRTPVVLLGDRRLLRQLLVNLLTNSLKFTPSGGRVSVSLRRSPEGGCVLTVADTGRGIPEEERERIFQPFVQLSDPFTRQQIGAGLGLPLVRRIADLHGADLDLETEVGRGSAFVITFPRERVPEAGCQQADRVSSDS